MSIDVFISYAHADRRLRDELAKHLSSLRNRGIINDWYDGDIVEGTEWEEQLTEHLNTAQIILLLVSPDFMASNFCYNVEMTRALARHDAHQARVIPIILRPVDWKKAPFAKLQALPSEGKPVVRWPHRDEAFLNIVQGIKRAIRDLQGDEGPSQQKNTTAPPSQQQSPGSSASSASRPVNEVHNRIGSISGRGHSIIQAGTNYTTTNHYYSSPDTHWQTPSLPKKQAASGISLASLQALVDELNALFASLALSGQEPLASSPEIEQKRLAFISMVSALTLQPVVIPEPLRTDVHNLYQKLRTDPLI